MKDLQTGIEIYAEPNQTVSRGTLRPCDLVPAFLEVIKDTPEYIQIMNSNDFDLKVISDGGSDKNDPRWESESISYLVNETLPDTLNSYAPNGFYFGSHVGDGSDFGYWENEEEENFDLKSYFYLEN